MTPPSDVPTVSDELLAQAGWVRALARRLAGDEERGEELAQRAFVVALERRPRVGDSLRPWLARVLGRISRHEARERSRARAREREAARPERDPRSADALVAELDEQRWLAERVRELDEPYRELVLRRHFRGEEIAAIAAATGRSPATVRSQLARAHRRLRERVEARARGEERSALSILLLACGEPAWPVASTAAVAMKTKTALALALVIALSSVVALRVAGIGPFAPAAGPVGAIEPAVSGGGPPMEEPAPAEVAHERSAALTNAETPAPEPEAAALPTRTLVALRAVDGRGAPLADATLALVKPDGSAGDVRPGRPSAADGRAELELPEDAVRVWRGQVLRERFALVAPWRATRFLEVVPRRAATVELGDVELAPGGALAGRVTDAGGRPVPGARVLATGAALSGALEDARLRGPGSDECHPRTVTDEGGAFSLAGLPVGEVRLWAHAEGYAWTIGEPRHVEPGRALGGHVLVLEEPAPETVMSGVVLDPAGAAVAGARVCFVDENDGSEGRFVSDAAGRFARPADGRGAFRLRAKDDHGRFGPSADAVWRPGDGELELRLTERLELALTLRDGNGAPVEGAWAVVSGDDGRDPGLAFERSGADGRAALVVPPERFHVGVGKRGYVDQRFGPYTRESAPRALEIELERQPMVRGVVRADGATVAGAQVLAYVDTRGEFIERTRGFPQRLFMGHGAPRETDAEGRFEIALEESEWDPVLLVSAPGLARAEVPVPPEAVGGDEPVEVELHAGGAIEGRVRVAGRPAQGVVVAASRGDHLGFAMRTDDDGRYRFEHLTPGPWRVETRDTEPALDVLSVANSPEEKDFRWNAEVVEGETSQLDLELATLEDTRVDGRFLVDGRPAVGWTAKLVRAGFERRAVPLGATTVGEAGAFELSAPTGRYDLELRSPAGAPAEVVALRPLALEGELVVWSGELRTATLAGTAEPGARLRLVRGRYREGEREIATFAADADGAFELSGLPAGSASFQLESDGPYGLGWHTQRTVELLPGARVELD